MATRSETDSVQDGFDALSSTSVIQPTTPQPSGTPSASQVNDVCVASWAPPWAQSSMRYPFITPHNRHPEPPQESTATMNLRQWREKLIGRRLVLNGQTYKLFLIAKYKKAWQQPLSDGSSTAKIPKEVHEWLAELEAREQVEKARGPFVDDVGYDVFEGIEIYVKDWSPKKQQVYGPEAHHGHGRNHLVLQIDDLSVIVDVQRAVLQDITTLSYRVNPRCLRKLAAADGA